MKTLKGLVLLAVLLAGALPLRAEGLYVLGALGGKTVSDQDFDDYYSTYTNAYYGGYDSLGEADVSLGWRFPGPMAVEALVGIDSGRDASADLGGGDFSSLQLQPMTTLAIGPVFCWDRPSWWFAESGVTELGLRLEYATLSGSEAISGTETDSQDFSGSTLGFGIFIRALNIWNPTGLNVGLEVGYDEDYFNSLKISDASGPTFAGANGETLNNYSGGNAYFDNSGGYIRLVIGWSQPSSHPLPPRRPYWRRRAYYRDYDDEDQYYQQQGAPQQSAPQQNAPAQNPPSQPAYGN